MRLIKIIALLLAATWVGECAAKPIVVDRVAPGAVFGAPETPAAPQPGQVARPRSYLVLTQSYGHDPLARNTGIGNLHYRLELKGGGIYELPSVGVGMDIWRDSSFEYPQIVSVVADLTLIELPPGDYEFKQFIGQRGGSYKMPFTGREMPLKFRVFSPKSPLSSSIHLEPGRVTYAGEVFLYLTGERFSIRFLNQEKRDLRLLFERFPDLDKSMVDVRVPHQFLTGDQPIGNGEPDDR